MFNDSAETATHTVWDESDNSVFYDINGAWWWTSKYDTNDTDNNHYWNNAITANYEKPNVCIGRNGTSIYNTILAQWTHSDLTSAWQTWKSYIGFAKRYINNWNQIATDKFDNYISDMQNAIRT